MTIAILSKIIFSLSLFLLRLLAHINSSRWNTKIFVKNYEKDIKKSPVLAEI